MLWYGDKSSYCVSGDIALNYGDHLLLRAHDFFFEFFLLFLPRRKVAFKKFEAVVKMQLDYEMLFIQR